MILRNSYVLAVHDVRASAEFYCRALGFEVVAEPPGWIFVSKGSCMIMLGECPDDMSTSELGCHNYFAYLEVTDVDEYHARIAASGLAPRLDAPADKPLGHERARAHYPDGHRVTIGQALGGDGDRP